MRDADLRGTSSGGGRLPLVLAMRLTFADYFRYFSDVCRITGGWIILLAVIIGAANAFKWSWAAWIFERFKAGDLHYAGVYPYISMALYLLMAMLLMLACVDVAVAWHRRILLSELPGWPGSCFAANRGWQYLALILLLSCATVLVTAAIVGAASADFDDYLPEYELSPIWDNLIGIAVALAVFITGPALFVRLALVLPARAIGDTDLTLIRSGKATRGSTWRLLIGGGCLIVIPSLFGQVVHYLFGTDPLRQTLGDLFNKETFPKGEWLEAAGLQIAAALALLSIPLYAGFLSHSYRHLIRRSPGDAIGEGCNPRGGAAGSV